MDYIFFEQVKGMLNFNKWTARSFEMFLPST